MAFGTEQQGQVPLPQLGRKSCSQVAPSEAQGSQWDKTCTAADQRSELTPLEVNARLYAGFTVLWMRAKGRSSPSLQCFELPDFVWEEEKTWLNSLIGKRPKETWVLKPSRSFGWRCMSLPLWWHSDLEKEREEKKISSFKDSFQIKTHDLVTKVFRMLKKTDFCGWKCAKRSTETPVPCSCLQQNIAWEGKKIPHARNYRGCKQAG